MSPKYTVTHILFFSNNFFSKKWKIQLNCLCFLWRLKCGARYFVFLGPSCTPKFEFVLKDLSMYASVTDAFC